MGKLKPHKQQKKQTESNGHYSVVNEMSKTERENIDQDQEITHSEQKTTNKYTDTVTQEGIKGIIGSLLEEMKQLRETIHKDITELQNTVSKQKSDISKLTNSDNELKKCLIEKTEQNAQKINIVLEENKILRKENNMLKDRLTQIEQIQLENNIIINGQPEQPWEPYELTKERVLDTIALSLGITDQELAKKTAKSTEIVRCKRIGRYRMGKSRPISVTFQKQEDKQKLLDNKMKLLTGIYVNEEFPAQVKRDWDMLRPILKLAKSLPQYREKS